jgi:hypothetical protein
MFDLSVHNKGETGEHGMKGSGIYFSIPVTSEANIEDPVNKFSNTMSTF